MTKVLLIGPTALDGEGRPIKQRRLHLPGLTLLMLAALTPPGIRLRLVHETVDEIPFDEDWDLVGITGMGSGIVRAWQIADEFRRRGARVVIGGIAASLADPEWSLAHADALVIGEAEETWPRVVRDAEAGRLQRIYRAVRPPPLDDLPVPRYDLMDRSKHGFWTPVQATRGCPHACRFCSTTAFHEGRHRRRPVDQVLRDVRAAKRFGSRHITFIDDNIGADFSYCAELWEALIPERITWMSQCSLLVAERPDLLRLARRSGCRLLSIGIESTGTEALAAVDKAWNRPERYARAVAALRRHGIEVSTEMILGLDGDDPSVFERTRAFIQDNRIAVPRIHILTPIPGTPLYEDLACQGRIIHREFQRYTGGQVVFRPRQLEPSDLQAAYWRLYEQLFSWRSILSRLTPNRAGLGPMMLAVVWGVNLHYRGHVRRRICPGIA